MERNGTVSVVIPAYNEGEMIAVTGKTLREFFCTANIPYELVFVDDGSKDETWDSIKELTRFHQANGAGTVKGISFSRNFGKESAIMAGLEEATGDCVVVIDCDLQHPYEKILDMYRLWSEGYDVVDGVKSDRGKESILHKAMSSLFYRIVSVAIGSDMKGSSDFKLLDRAVVTEILKCKEHDPFFRGLSAWAGFKRTKVEYEVRERTKGQSKWSFRSLARYAIRNITYFSSAPKNDTVYHRYHPSHGGFCHACSDNCVFITRKRYLSGSDAWYDHCHGNRAYPCLGRDYSLLRGKDIQRSTGKGKIYRSRKNRKQCR